jgi:Protein of unknown function (DUF2480)
MEEIINKVAQSDLQVFDLEDYFPEEAHIATLDISQFLYEGFILKEKEFRETLKNFDWSVFQDKYVAINCSSDAILPAWAYALITVYVSEVALRVVQGNKKEVIITWYQDILNKLDYASYQNKPLILKGCSKKNVPNEIYSLAIIPLKKVAKSIMFGEACSAVPLYKAKK